jgi:hypothetical protein
VLPSKKGPVDKKPIHDSIHKAGTRFNRMPALFSAITDDDTDKDAEN